MYRFLLTADRLNVNSFANLLTMIQSNAGFTTKQLAILTTGVIEHNGSQSYNFVLNTLKTIVSQNIQRDPANNIFGKAVISELMNGGILTHADAWEYDTNQPLANISWNLV